MKKYLVCFCLFVSAPLAAGEPTGAEIVAKSESLIRGATQISLFSITIKTRRWTRTMEMKSWDVRAQKKNFSEITAPKKDAGTRFLLVGSDMRQYVPRIQSTIRIAPSMMLQSWMGSDFTNDDIVKMSSIVDDYTQTLKGRERADGNECYRVELVPRKDAAVVWGKIVYFARTADCLPVREEFYNEHNVLKKVMSFSGFAVKGGRMIPTVYTMRTEGNADQYTMMTIRDTKFDAPIPASVFSLQNLERR